jgi:hypothetical protein
MKREEIRHLFEILLRDAPERPGLPHAGKVESVPDDMTVLKVV